MWNIETCAQTRRLQVTRPYYLFAHNDKILSTSLSKHDDEDNCVFITAKRNPLDKKSIKLDDWCQLSGLHVDQYDHIHTIAYKLDSSRTQSDFPYLFIIHMNGDRLRELPIKNLNGFAFACMLGSKVVFSGGSDYNGLRIVTLHSSFAKKNGAKSSLNRKPKQLGLLYSD
jgi:hypothetical protein